MSDKHDSEVALLNKKTQFVTCITMKVRDLLYTKMTKLQVELESQIVASGKSIETLMTLKEERDKIENDRKTIVDN